MTPVWPLADYVAVNPFNGFSDSKFLNAASQLASLSSIEMLMPMDYYRQQYRTGELTRQNINAALDELVSDGVAGVECLDINQILSMLHESPKDDLPSETTDRTSTRLGGEVNTLVDYIDQYCKTQWSVAIAEELSKHCAHFYDSGQAMWRSHHSSNSLYQAWREAASVDRNFEILGVPGVRRFVSSLPGSPEKALVYLLRRLQVPEAIWQELLLCESLKLPGWSAWTRYQDQQRQQSEEPGSDFEALLAMRLAYEYAISDHLQFAVNWSSMAEHFRTISSEDSQAYKEKLVRYALLKASEIGVRVRLLERIPGTAARVRQSDRCLSQMVFCIDVRSERMRRHLEAGSRSIQTFGFAGFFGLPIEYVPFAEEHGHACVPVLLTPKFKVHEGLEGVADSPLATASNRRAARRSLRKAWLDFQASAASCFSFVESLGLGFSFKLIGKSLGLPTRTSSRFDGFSKEQEKLLGPALSGLEEQGLTSEGQIELAESILRGIGIVENFARLVVFCGHGSQGENNPLQAGLDCGACGGHTGEANARLAAKLLNQGFVREGLARQGIQVPPDTHFLAALHTTTTDDLQFFDLHHLPPTLKSDLEELLSCTAQASEWTRRERQAGLSSPSLDDLLRRSRDWSEVRPEWGLAGNAAFIVGPREWTRGVPMDGRVFLHSYQYTGDPEYKILEQIMTAPMIVAHWINMQYYASTVDPAYFGSGTKTIHNVVGKFGLLSGSTGDLMTGLPWQSLHDGRRYQHEPLRLLAIIAAPRSAIDAVLAKNAFVKDTLRNGWMQLVAAEGNTRYRYTERGVWDELVVSKDLSSEADQLLTC